MKKRYFLLILIISFLLTGCTTNEKDAIYSTVSRYLDALKSGELENAQSYCDKSYYDALGVQSFTSNLDAQLKEIDLGEDFNKSAKDFVSEVSRNSVQSYEIKNYTLDEDTATVIVDITGINLSNVDMNLAQQNAMQEYTTYMTDHFEELNQILNTEGEEAMKDVLIKELSSMLFNNLSAEMNKTKLQSRTVDFYLKKIEGTWKIASQEQ